MKFSDIDISFSPDFAVMNKLFNASFTETDQEIPVQFGQIETVTKLVGGDIYEGTYDVRPAVEPQTLETRHKVMRDDVNIQKIPYAEVTNTSGGITATIG